MQRQILDQAERPFVNRRVDNDQGKNGDRHAKRHVDVRRRHDLHIRNAGRRSAEGNPVDRNQVHQVHQEYPHENRQAQRCDQAALAVEGFLNARIHKVDDNLDECLKAAGRVDRRFSRRAPEQPDENQAKQQRPEHRVDIDRPEVPGTFVPYPGSSLVLAHLEILQMVRDVLAGSLLALSAFTRHVFTRLSLVSRCPAA